MLVTTITIILIIGLATALGFSSKENNSLKNQIDELHGSLETARQEKEMVDATRQLLRNEVTVLQSKIRVMESKSMHPVIDAPKTEEVKKKKKYFKKKPAPKMSAEKK
jgi:chromosome segregation ATPase